jgi:hypothetical protein
MPWKETCAMEELGQRLGARWPSECMLQRGHRRRFLQWAHRGSHRKFVTNWKKKKTCGWLEFCSGWRCKGHQFSSLDKETDIMLEARTTMRTKGPVHGGFKDPRQPELQVPCPICV